MKQGMVFAVSVFFVLIFLHGAHAQGAVTILTSDNTADNAVARVWADKLGATLIVTPWGSLSSETLNDVISSQPTLVYIVGGDVAIPQAEERLNSFDLLTFSNGCSTRHETSLDVAERFGSARAVLRRI